MEGKRGRGVDEFLAALTAIRRAWPQAVVKDDNILLREVPFKVSVQEAAPMKKNNNNNNNKRHGRKQQQEEAGDSKDLWIGEQADLKQVNPDKRQRCMAEITAAVEQYKQDYLQAQQLKLALLHQ